MLYMNKYFINNDLLTCMLHGKLDTLNSSVFESEIGEHMTKEVHSVIFDMQEVNYISSTFLRIVIKTAQALGKEKFMIRNVQPSVMKVFKMANLADLIKFE